MPAKQRARWGWHRLSEEWADRLVAQARIRPGDLVLDVGAGTAALTAPLVAAGARVIAVELHPDRARQLRERFASAPVTVVRADAADLRLPRRPFRVVANPPFGVTTALLKRLVSPGSRLIRADLVIPRYAALRWTGSGAPGASRWTRDFAIHVTSGIPGCAFDPPAPGPTAHLCIERRAASHGAM